MYACGWPPDAPTVSTRITDPFILFIGSDLLPSLSLDSSDLQSDTDPAHFLSFITVICLDENEKQPGRDHVASALTSLSVLGYLHLYTCWINPFHVIIFLSFCIATVPPAFLPYGDVMETKYCKTVNSALTPVPRSYQHQPLSKRSKKNNLSMDLFVHVNSLIFLYCAMKSWPCPSFLCSRIHSCCTVSELSQLWVFF